VTKFLTKEQNVSSNFLVVKMPPESAANMLFTKYGTVDMSPQTKDDFSKLVSSENCENTFVAVGRSDLSQDILELEKQDTGNDDKLGEAVEKAIQSGECNSYGGVALWNGSAVKMFKVKRLVFRKETWLSLPFQIFISCILFGGLSLWWWHFLCRMCLAASSLGLMTWSITGSNDSTWGLWSLSLLLVEMFLITIATVGAYKLVIFFRFIISRNLSHLSARGFAPFSHGPQGIDCLRVALISSQNYSREKGYGLWLMNVDKNHPDTEAFSKSGFKTKFLQKWLIDSPNEDGTDDLNEWEEFLPEAFCDPRDL